MSASLAWQSNQKSSQLSFASMSNFLAGGFFSSIFFLNAALGASPFGTTGAAAADAFPPPSSSRSRSSSSPQPLWLVVFLFRTFEPSSSSSSRKYGLLLSWLSSLCCGRGSRCLTFDRRHFCFLFYFAVLVFSRITLVFCFNRCSC